MIGDVHTHPGRGVHQSGIDAANPMVAQKGHVALIVPRLRHAPDRAARGRGPPLRRPEWQTWTGQAAARRLFMRRFV